MTAYLKPLLDRLAAPSDQTRGVALLAVAAALLVAGTATVFTVRTLESERALERLEVTKKGTKKIEQAIALWVNADNETSPRLPCPANPTDSANFGQEVSQTNNVCSLNRGIVPFVTLASATNSGGTVETGFTEDDAIDEYGNYYTYVVDANSVSICTETGDGNGRTGTLSDNAGGSTTVYALISHGQNGAGAYNSTRAQNAAAPNTLEDDNCPISTGDCSSTVSGEYRSGPFDEASDTYFDDTVTAVTGTSFNVECFELFGDQLLAGEGTTNDRPAGSESSFEGNQASTNYNNQSSGERRNAVISTEDPDGTADTGDEYVQVYLRSGSGQARSSCFWNEGAIDLQNRTVRAYVEASFQQDVSDALRGGLIMGFLRGDEPIASDLCGGDDERLGWIDQSSNTLPTEKFGVELDVEGTVNTYAAYEPSVNHISVIATNIDHSGDDPADTTDRDGPTCTGVEVDDPGTFSSVGLGSADPAEQTLADMEGCYPNTVDWLESGTTTFHGFRVELHNHDGNNCHATNPEDYIRINGWAFENASCSGDCETLLSDYTDQNPSVSYCIPYEAVFQTLRFGFTSAGPSQSSGQGNEPRIRQFGINSDITDAVTKNAITATDETIQLSSQNYADEAGLTCNSGQDTPSNVIVDDDYTSALPNQRNPVFRAYRGVLSCNSGGRMGVQGITDERRLDHVGVDTSLWEDLFRREAIEVEFPETVTRYMVHLRDFDNPAESFAAAERSVILAYDQNTYVGRKDVTACSSGNDFAVIGAFNGTAFDRLLIIPEPADQTYTNSDGYADHWVDAVKGCGAENACFPENIDATNVTGLESDCYDADLDTFALPGTVTLSSSTPEMNFGNLHTDLGASGTDAFGALLKMDTYGMKAFTASEADVVLHDQTDRGIGVASSSGDNHLESDASESLTFLFNQAYNQLRLNISRFDENTTTQEQVQVEFRLGDQTRGTTTAVSCDESNAGETDGGIDTGRVFNITPTGAFDRVIITPLADTGGGDTDVFIREVRACEASVDCDLSSNGTSECSIDPTDGFVLNAS